MRKLVKRFSILPLWAKAIACVVVVLVAVFILARAAGALQLMIFGNVEAKREHAGAVVVQEQGRAAKETGQEATTTVVRTHEYYTTVDRTVKESQNAVSKADHGQQMDPAIDAAVADGLCRLHDDLCRR